VWQDILNLEAGQRWEKEIYKHIDGCDIFYLFWSHHAEASEWVLKEAAYALKRNKETEMPEIRIKNLEFPPPPPPEGLKEIQFIGPIDRHIMAELALAANRAGDNPLASTSAP